MTGPSFPRRMTHCWSWDADIHAIRLDGAGALRTACGRAVWPLYTELREAASATCAGCVAALAAQPDGESS